MSTGSSTTTKIYVVKKYDSFWSIAEAKLGKGIRYKEILKLNNMNENDTLKEGAKIKLPVKAAEISVSTPSYSGSGIVVPRYMSGTTISTGPSTTTKIYVVKKDDSFWSIAENRLGKGIRYKEIVKE